MMNTEAEKARSGRRALRTIRLALSLVWASGRSQVIFIVASTIVMSLCVAGQLLVGRQLLDLLAGSTDVDAGELAPYLAALGVMLMVSALSQAVASELRSPLQEKVQRHTMNEILDISTEIPLEDYERAEFHDRLERARFGANAQSTAVVFGIVTIISTLVVAVGVVAVLLSVVPLLVPVAVIGYLPIAYVNVRNNKATYQLEWELTELQRERTYLEFVMTDRVEAKEIRAYGIVPTLRGWHSDLWDTRIERLQQLVSKRLRLTTIGSFVTTAVLIATLSIALILAGDGSISIGDAAVAIVGLQQLSGRLQSAGSAFGGVHQGVTFLQDFERFRATLPQIRDLRPSGTPPTPPRVLSVNELSYRYPGAADDAVTSVSFELRRGQIMAVVGANGSGKSTLSKLLCGLIPPGHGGVAWDGVDLAVCDPGLVRAQIAPVFQDYARYLLTIRQAIALGDVARLDDDRGIVRAAEQSGLADLIASLPGGLDARLGKAFTNGTDLSIGQWQRLAIARALFRDAPVVIMDEPSASLDPRGEAELFDLLQSLGDDRIVIFVSHRFATVRSADVVLVLDQGAVVEMGTHDELMRAEGLYHDLFTLQADRYGFAH
jgi:ATP-binding cassette subfamily B protein